MNFLKFFWFSGRAPRWLYWLFVLPPWFLIALAFNNFMFPENQTLPILTNWISDLTAKMTDPSVQSSDKTFSDHASNLAFLLFAYIYNVVIVKRLHDRDKSGFWLIGIYLPYILFFVYFIFRDHLPEIKNSDFLVISFIISKILSWIVSCWMLIELGFFAGTKGPNKYGPDPKEKSV